MPSALARVAVVLLAVGLQGCMTALYLADRPSQSVIDEMARRCAKDSGIHWYGDRPEGIDLWLPGESTLDPAEDPELRSIRPYRLYSADEAFLATGVARALYVQIQPTSDYYFGPGRSEPAGTYRFRMFEEGDPHCGPWLAYWAAQARPGAKPYRRPDGKCLAWDRVGPISSAGKLNVFIRYIDGPARARGLWRDGEVLFIDGKERARFTSYAAINPNSAAERRGRLGIAACETGPIGTTAILGPD